MPSQESIRAASFIEQLARAIADARPYFQNQSGKRERHDFPNTPGVYAVERLAMQVFFPRFNIKDR